MNTRGLGKRILLAVTVTAAAIVGTPIVTHAQGADAVRASYSKGNPAPDALFLPYFLNYVVRLTDSIPDRTRALSIVSNNLKLDDSGEAEEHLRLIREVRDQVELGKDEFMRDSVCPRNSMRASGVAFYDRLDEADDNTSQLGDHALAVLQESMEPTVFLNFLEWMAAKKKSSTLTLTNHRVAYADRDPGLVQERICGFFDSINSNPNQ